MSTTPSALSNYNLPDPVAQAPDLIRAQRVFMASGDYDVDSVSGVRATSGAGDATADVAALQRAVNAAHNRYVITGQMTIIDGSGAKYYLRPGETAVTEFYQPSAAVDVHDCYGAIQLKSGVAFANCTFLGAPMLTVPDDDEHIELWFWTAMDNERRTLTDIAFENCTFDFGSTKWANVEDIPNFIYAIGVSGVDRVWRNRCTFKNSRIAEYEAYGEYGLYPNRGRAMLIANCDNVSMLWDNNHDITQGIFAHWCRNVHLAFGTSKNVAEHYDFDNPCWRVHIHHMVFEDSAISANPAARGDGDCIDFGGGKFWVIESITASHTGAITQIYHKPWAYASYELYLAAQGVPMPEDECGNLVVPEFVTIQNIYGEFAGLLDEDTVRTGAGAMRIGQDRQTDTWENLGYTNTLAGGLGNLVGVQHVTVTNVNLVDSGPIYARDCLDLKMQAVTMIRPKSENLSGDTYRNAGLVLSQSTATADIDSVTRLTGYAKDIHIEDAEGGWVYVVKPGPFLLENVTGRGYNTLDSDYSRYGVLFSRLGEKGGLIQIGKLDLKGGAGSSDTLLFFAATDPVDAEFRMHKTGGWNLYPTNSARRIASTGRVGDRWVMASETRKFTNWDTVSTSAVQTDFTQNASNYRAILGAFASPALAISPGHATDNTRIGIRRNGSLLNSLGSALMDNTARSAREIVKFSGDSFENIDVLEPGDIISAVALRSDGGSGSTYTGDWYLTYSYADFTSVDGA